MDLDPLSLGVLGDDDKRFLRWVKEKHHDQELAFVNRIVTACAAEFVLKGGQLTEDKRAEIYSRVRKALEKPDMDRLHKHMAVRCCS